MGKKVLISVDYACCQGCGTCAAIAPDLFELRDDGKAWPVQDVVELDDEQMKLLEEAMRDCPLHCISYQEQE